MLQHLLLTSKKFSCTLLSVPLEPFWDGRALKNAATVNNMCTRPKQRNKPLIPDTGTKGSTKTLTGPRFVASTFSHHNPPYTVTAPPRRGFRTLRQWASLARFLHVLARQVKPDGSSKSLAQVANPPERGRPFRLTNSVQ